MLGLVTAATGVGGSVICVFLTGIIGSAGWRMSFVICGLMTAVVSVLLGLFVCDYPSVFGLHILVCILAGCDRKRLEREETLER